MCGRYFIDESPELRPFIEQMNRSPLLPLFGNAPRAEAGAEVKPSFIVPAVALNRRGEKAVFPMRWGFSGKSLVINARAETAAVRPMFRDAWAAHRCLLPASWYFEWEHPDGERTKAGHKYAIRPSVGQITWLCGLYRPENGLPCCVVITRESAKGIRFIHPRMPLILPDGAAERWILPDVFPLETAAEALTEMHCQKAI